MQGKTPLRSPPHVTRTGARVAEADEGLLVALAVLGAAKRSPVGSAGNSGWFYFPVAGCHPDGIADISFHGGGQLSHGYTNFTCGQCRVDWCAVHY